MTNERSSDEVTNNNEKQKKQRFVNSKKWYTADGENFKPSERKMQYRNNYYLDITNDLKKQLDKHDEVRN